MRLVQAFFTATAFLTRIPVPGRGTLLPKVAGLSVVFFPAVGLLLGLASGGLGWLILDRLGLAPHPLWALLLVALGAFLTGALHLDGLSDVVDGLGGSRGDRERALEIMKDPGIGAFGTVALVLVLLGKVLAVESVLQMPGHLAILVACPVAARFGAVLLVVFFPCARPTGLARTFHEESHGLGALVAAVATAGAHEFLGRELFLPLAAAVAVSLAAGIWISLRLRGLTGDAYGAAIELAELAFLWAAAFPRLRGG